MTSPQPTVPPSHRIKNNARQFWYRVSEGLAVNQLWSQFEKDARSSYRLYSAGLDKLPAEPSRLKRAWQMAKALFWAILEKLTPARRVLLLLALILLFFPGGGFTYINGDKHVEVQGVDLHFWGGLLMFVVLLLELADRVVMKRDLEIAKDIQAWLLPGAPLQIPGYQIAYATRPANTVAGDYYDVILRPGRRSSRMSSENQSGGQSEGQSEDKSEDRILFVVADVAGKSIPAAMLMATFQASLRTLSTSGVALAELVAGVNRYACSNSAGGNRFTTAFLAELDAATGDVVYINAGHNVPILRKKSGFVERLEVGGIPVGILAEAPYQSGTARLEPGDWLVIFTDGVVEAVNAKDEEYGEAALLRLVDRESGSAPAELLRSLLAELDRHVGNTPQHDDITCLLLKRT
ncbi:MAG TPA: PP2C family protein-serine/threonine phosphatase [Terriglobales bacterium]|nr:PP2C family protein-serine/threonine phosphatase [Terriglobales bacterium]